MTASQMEALAAEALEVALRHIQSKLGVTDGDVAAAMFEDDRERAAIVTREFVDYIGTEIEARQPMPEPYES